MQAQGVNPILPTPFLADGALDIPSLRRLIDFQKAANVNGVAILGFMGEAHKLSEAERRQVIEVVVEQSANELDVWVGVRALGTMGAVEQCRVAQAAGADAVFVAPIDIQSDEALYQHFKTVAEAVDIPVMIHDFPGSFNTILSAQLIARLGRDGHCPFIKLEDPPIGPKMSQIAALSEGTVGVFGGLGGLYYLEELERGALGIMTGFSFPEVLVQIYNEYRSGDVDKARVTFDHYASLIRYEFQPKIGLAYRKHIYHKRGVFSTTTVRPPAMGLDPYSAVELERTIARAGLKI